VNLGPGWVEPVRFLFKGLGSDRLNLDRPMNQEVQIRSSNTSSQPFDLNQRVKNASRE